MLEDVDKIEQQNMMKGVTIIDKDFTGCLVLSSAVRVL
jgi:hypothetical protein